MVKRSSTDRGSKHESKEHGMNIITVLVKSDSYSNVKHIVSRADEILRIECHGGYLYA